MTDSLYRPTHASHDAPCLLCRDWCRDTGPCGRRLAAHQFAAECGGSPAQLDHYAWQHLSSTPGYWSDNGPWENN